jgi:CTP synthase
MQPKIIVVTGGVLSGLGKGIATASLARLLKGEQKIITVKCDGYLNVDPGTMNPIEHGEVFVLDDGGEVDMDFGHYERFIGVTCKSNWNLTSGKIFSKVIAKERKGDYLGKTIQIYPHVVDEIKQWWDSLMQKESPGLMCIEIGGTIGDDETSWFIKAVSDLRQKYGDDVAYIHLTYLPFLHNVGELKTKAAQRDIALLREKGIFPDLVICRGKDPVPGEMRAKLARQCGLKVEQIISGEDLPSIYQVPLHYRAQGVDKYLSERLSLPIGDLTNWERLVNNMDNPEYEVTIAVCGKYTKLNDSYASIIEALKHAGAHHKAKVNIKWVDTETVQNAEQELSDVQGIIVPGGFGPRGAEGMIESARYARESGTPYLGICYGLQMAVIEYARNVCGLAANTTESDPEVECPIVAILPEQKDVKNKGGTMRLGSYGANLIEGSRVRALYGDKCAAERHRHRFEVNPEFHDVLRENGLTISGLSPDGRLAEFIEIEDHPYFVATQAHPELTSRLEAPNPLFLGLVKAAIDKSQS